MAERSPCGPRRVTGRELDWLAHGWRLLKLSIEAPERIPGPDAVILTAASAGQARLYELQLESARLRGSLGEKTFAMAAPDPEGKRIGSGGATLAALRLLAERLPGSDLSKLRVLLIHAGGDSRRVPWANIIGKPFIPFPLLAGPDRSVPTLFDHLLAVASPLMLAMPKGGLLTLAGDVLPIIPPIGFAFPEGGAVAVTTPASLDLAGRHGVFVQSTDARGSGSAPAADLLQKATPEELARAGALIEGGAALIDTGVFAFTGSAYRRIASLASSDPDPVEELLAVGAEISLYEEIVSAFVPARVPWLLRRPLGERLAGALAGETLHLARADGLTFIHLGSTAEIMAHLGRSWHGRLPRRILAAAGTPVADSALVFASELAPGATVGAKSLVYASRLGSGARVGNRCVVIGVDSGDEPFRLRDNSCLWQAPLAAGGEGSGSLVTVCCGVDDNPKEPVESATFCNRSFNRWRDDHGVTPEDLWRAGEEKTLWNARLFPAEPLPGGMSLVGWLLGSRGEGGPLEERWRKAERLSLAGLHGSADPVGLLERLEAVTGELVIRAMGEAVSGGLERNVCALGTQLRARDLRTRAAELIGLLPEAHDASVPASRLLQVRAGLLRTAGKEEEAAEADAGAFAAVQGEVAAAVEAREAEPVRGIPAGGRARAELPVRFDFAGGWSDTPPYCLERPAAVLNFAVSLDGKLPVGAEVEALDERVWEIELDDSGNRTVLREPFEGTAGAGLADPFLLPRHALLVCGYGSEGTITQGVRVRTWARVPKGSGMGASSILGAALVQSLARLAGRPDDPLTVSKLVLVLEQRMTTGGGWQDQVGGLFGGVKYASSVPAVPLRFNVEPVPLLAATAAELHARFVIAFTGQERLAKNVLQMVVRRYLQRDARALSAMERLVELAGEGRRSLAMGDLDGLGCIIDEAWHVHQELDPHCSNPAADSIFRRVAPYSSGAKLAGAGGGGFIGIMAKDEEAAGRIREVLERHGSGVRVYDWSLEQRRA